MENENKYSYLKQIDFQSRPIIANGKSKTIYALDEEIAIMFYKPHLRSVTNKREGIIEGTDVYRMYATMFFLNLMEANGIPTERVNKKILCSRLNSKAFPYICNRRAKV